MGFFAPRSNLLVPQWPAFGWQAQGLVFWAPVIGPQLPGAVELVNRFKPTATLTSGSGATRFFKTAVPQLNIEAADFDDTAARRVGFVNSQRIQPTAAITMSAWARRPVRADEGALLTKAQDGPWMHLTILPTGVARFTMTTSGTSNLDGTTDLEDNEPHLITGTYDGANMRTYVDGVEEASLGKTGSITYVNTEKWTIGGWDGRVDNPHFGQIWDCRVYDRALTATEVQLLYSVRDRHALFVPRRTFVSVAGGTTIAAGLASETDTAFSVTSLKARSVGLALETDTSLAVAANRARAVGLVTETDSAFATTQLKTATVGLASESDTALAVGKAKLKAAALALETDTAFAVANLKGKVVGLALETDTALAVTSTKLLAVGLALETDTAFAVTVGGQTIIVGLALETDTAFAVAHARALTAGLALEIDVARPVTIVGGILVSAGRSVGMLANTGKFMGRM